MSSKDIHPRSEIFRPALTCLALFIGATLSLASSGSPPPNLLFVLADDLGYMEQNDWREQQNLADKLPDKAKALFSELNRCSTRVSPPNTCPI